MDDATYKRWLNEATDRFAATLQRADLDRQVAACPGWDVAALVEHVVAIHAWVERILATGSAHKGGAEHRPPERTAPAYAAWYRERSAAMERAMAEHDPGESCWNFSGVNPTCGFWPRRQTHEVGVHTVDGALARGSELALDPDVAADGIDELLRVFGVRMPQRGARAALTATLTIQPTDTGRAWTVSPPEEKSGAVQVDDGAGSTSAATLSGTASDLLLVLWKRLPVDRLTISGDTTVAAGYLGSRLAP